MHLHNLPGLSMAVTTYKVDFAWGGFNKYGYAGSYYASPYIQGISKCCNEMERATERIFYLSSNEPLLCGLKQRIAKDFN